ncbi:MAG: ribulose-phosphate 3-epimerase [Planctomycetota bacterium]|jgi:ribulose-phosphate 3-epimerase
MQSKTLFDQLSQKTPLVSVGVLSADLMSLGSDLKLLERAGVGLLHFDIMDGCFCLMVNEPLDKLESYVEAGADMITVHVESCRHTHRILQKLGEMTNASDPARSIVRGVALNPGTPLEAVLPLIDEVEMVFLLGVNPGWGGQKFIASTQRRLKQLKAMIAESGREILTGVDGGITRNNIADVARMEADIIVTGSAVFDGKTPLKNARFMIRAANDAAEGLNANET